jgi:hypothetical protein
VNTGHEDRPQNPLQKAAFKVVKILKILSVLKSTVAPGMRAPTVHAKNSLFLRIQAQQRPSVRQVSIEMRSQISVFSNCFFIF